MTCPKCGEKCAYVICGWWCRACGWDDIDPNEAPAKFLKSHSDD